MIESVPWGPALAVSIREAMLAWTMAAREKGNADRVALRPMPMTEVRNLAVCAANPMPSLEANPDGSPQVRLQ